MNVRHISLDIDKRPCTTQVLFGRGDSGGVTVTAEIFDAGEAVSLSGASVKLVALCSGGNVEIPCSISGSTATATFGEREIGESCYAYLRVEVGDRKYSTGRFMIREVV